MKIRKKKVLISSIIVFYLLFFSISLIAYGHGDQLGEDDHEEEKSPATIGTTEKFDTGVELSQIAQNSIGLKTADADFRNVEDVLQLSGIIKPEPDRVGEVSTRAEGRVEKVYANLGDSVKKGQKLAVFLPRQMGDPPLVSINAPLSGIIIERNISLGGTVESNKTLFRIADLSKLIVEGEVFENDVFKVKLGQSARIRLDAYPENVFEGKVIFIASELDPMKRTQPIWVLVDNKDGLLKPELFARIAVVIEHSKEVITIPNEAVIDNGAEKFVFIKNGNQFIKQDVTTGIKDDRYVEIRDGLYPGDQVVTDGNRQIYTKWLFSR
ncbi:MAG: efflux RND transporter periplasmic adaptor subunit [Thermodesulfobacteriota bacterium]